MLKHPQWILPNGRIFAVWGYDFGAIWYQNERLNKEHYLSGFGAGLHFHLPYVDIFRFEVGFDKELNHEFIGEVMVSF